MFAQSEPAAPSFFAELGSDGGQHHLSNQMQITRLTQYMPRDAWVHDYM